MSSLADQWLVKFKAALEDLVGQARIPIKKERDEQRERADHLDAMLTKERAELRKTELLLNDAITTASLHEDYGKELRECARLLGVENKHFGCVIQGVQDLKADRGWEEDELRERCARLEKLIHSLTKGSPGQEDEVMRLRALVVKECGDHERAVKLVHAQEKRLAEMEAEVQSANATIVRIVDVLAPHLPEALLNGTPKDKEFQRWLARQGD